MTCNLISTQCFGIEQRYEDYLKQAILKMSEKDAFKFHLRQISCNKTNVFTDLREL